MRLNREGHVDIKEKEGMHRKIWWGSPGTCTLLVRQEMEDNIKVDVR
jgi:hypothetical protein